jgi:penicillin-binding protein 2
MSLSEPPEDPRARANLTPALAVRVAIVGSLVLALFAIIFFRLWFLQVLTGTHYVEAAALNTTRVVHVAPPRGEILARGGTVLVSSTTALAVEIDPTALPVKVNQSNILTTYKRDDAVYDRLAHVIGMGRKRHPCKVATPPPSCNVSTGSCPRSTTRDLSPIACTVARQIALNFYADVTVKSPVSTRVQYFIDERANRFRGVDVEQTSVSGYPYRDLAAQALGTVGRLTTTEEKQKSFKHVNPSAVVGQSGLEYEYDQFLRGTYGKQKVTVNADGVAVGVGHSVAPKAGDDLKTTLDLGVQQVGQSALNHSIIENDGLGGAFVAMNPQNGEIYGMGSLPSFNPSIFTHPTTEREYRKAFGPGTDNPQFNRAIQSVAPTGSTFKVITSVAALQSGDWTPDETYDDIGEFCPDGPAVQSACVHNSGDASYGVVDMESALKVSDDVFYYHLGDILNVDTPRGGPLQTWARRLGIGRNPHIDLPHANDGNLPTPAWFDRRSRLEQECETATGEFRYTNGRGQLSATPKQGYHRSPKHPLSTGGCGLGTPGVTWTVGDNINAAVGQGDDEVSPLQLAMVYSAIENGGTIVRPHLGDAIQNAEGTVLQKLSSPAQRHLDINPTYLDTIRTGLHEAAQGGGTDPSPGTSETVMQNFGQQVYGKTGTAQYFENGIEKDYSWYVCYVPASATSKPILVVVWVEGGGFGAVASAPVARQILSQWFYGKPGPYIAGVSKDQ